MWLALLAALALCLGAAGTAAAIDPVKRSNYIVQLRDAPLALYTGGIAGLAPTNPAARGATRLNPDSAASVAYLDHLERRQAAALAAISTSLGRDVTPRFSYRTAYNGLAVALSAGEAEVVRGLPQVARVVADQRLHTVTDNGPAWMDADAVWDGSATGTATKGEGIVAGIIDTGVNSDHPSFATVGGDGYVHTNSRVVRFGVCAVNVLKCNDKLIGMYDFTGTGEEDDVGHGSHTASTVAGNVVNSTLYAPTITLGPRRISGVAPHANIISYKVCSATAFPELGSCPVTAIVAGIEQATLDVVDVINFSIGGGATNPWQDPLGQAFFGTQAAGVFVAASAGNEGPGASTVGRPSNSPWLLSVGASTHDRRPTGRLSVTSDAGAGPSFTGMTIASGVGPLALVDAQALGNDLCNPFTPAQAAQIAGKIVICTQGVIGRVAKGQNVKDAGGAGMVLVSLPGYKASVVGDTHVLPAVMISEFDGIELRSWLVGATNPQATISGVTLEENPALADRMAAFSSRGPDPTNLDVIKPDVTAPGVTIWAAFNSHSGPPGTPEYNVIQGTSMSSPHAAGAAALVRAANPSWTPDNVKSALMTTAYTSPRGGREVVPVTKEDHSTPADPFDMGGGRIDAARAARAGLILNETVANYQAANPAAGGDPKTLNLASLANPNCVGSCSWTRTVTSAAPAQVRWTATTVAPAGVTLTVAPATFTLDPGQSQTLTITATTTGLAPGFWRFGSVTLAKAITSIPLPPAVHPTRLPVALRVQAGDVPPPCVIEEGVRTDPAEINVAPAHNIREVGTSGLYPTFAGQELRNIVFRMKVATLDPLPPTSHWRISFQTPEQPAHISWFVQMLRGPDPNADPTFVYGTLDSAASEFTVLGTPETGTWSADGTIKITIAASKVGNPQPGDVLIGITGAAGPGVPGTVTTNSDSTTNGAGPTTYTLKPGCPGENFPPVAHIRTEPANATIREGEEVAFDGSGSTDDRTPSTELTYEWDFEDDGIYDATGPTVTRRYLVAGSYRVRLRVTDAEGLSDTETVIVTVTPFCPTTTFSDDLEPTPAPGWVVDTAVNESPLAAPWTHEEDPPLSSNHSWFGDARTTMLKDDRLMTPAQDLTATSRLTFWHRFHFEPGFDGGVLEVSSDGGPWRDVLEAGATFVEGGYNDTISTEFGSPIAGRAAWSGGPIDAQLAPMERVVVNVGALAGENVRFRFRLAADEFAVDARPGIGWWIDDLELTGIPLPCNRPPVANDDSASTTEGTPVEIDVLANDSDPENDALEVTAVTEPANGSVVNNGTSVTYTPNAGFVSPPDDTFTYTVSDGENSVTANVSVTVNRRPNREPTAGDDNAETLKNTPVTIAVLTNDSDPDGDALKVKSPTTTQPQNGSASVNADNTITYTPNDGFDGIDMFDYTVEDGNGGEDTATVTVTVKEPPNRPPTAADDTANTQKNTAVTVKVTANDTDPDGDPLSVTSFTQPPNGTVVNEGGGNLRYTPKNDFVGTDSFSYTISDGRSGTSSATVRITVSEAPNRPPLARGDSAKTTRNKSVTIEVLRNDSDPDGDALTVTQASDPPHGTVRINRGRTITYTPDRGFVGMDTFTYTISDGKDGTSTAEVTVKVTRGDDDDGGGDDESDDDDD